MPHHSNTPKNHTLHRWELGLVATAAAVIASPYVLPMVGLGDVALTDAVTSMCGTTKGGLSQTLEGLLGKTPLIGAVIGGVGWGAALSSGAIGIAGVLIGDYIHRHYDRKGHIQWGTVIKYAALTTSVLIALPSILSGISMGITYISGLFNGGVPMQGVRGFMGSTLGFSGIAHTAPTGLAGLLPHLFTCGRALLPVGAALLTNHAGGKANGTGCEVRMATHSPCIQGVPCEVAFQLIDPSTGRALGEDELQTVHTRKLHTMILDNTLSDYHHLHPEYDPARKLFVCHFTPARTGGYSMWNDLLIKGELSPTHIKTKLGPMPQHFFRPRVTHAADVEAAGLTFHISSEGPLRAGEDNLLTIDIRDAIGHPVQNLEPIMGAYAHLAGFSADGQHFIHTHPLGLEPSADTARGGSPLRFHLTPPAAGATQFFLQIQQNGQVLTVPFGQLVAQSRRVEQQQAAGTFMTSMIAGRMGR